MSRHFTITWFIPEDYPHDPSAGPFEVGQQHEDLLRYFICQLEKCPRTERLHFQGYAQFNEKTSFKRAAECLGMPGAHFEKPKYDSSVQVRYCSKAKSYIAGPWECGEYCEMQGERTDLKRAAALVKEGKIDAVEDNTYIKYHRGLNALALRDAPRRTEMPMVFILWGPTGTGKSHTARAVTQENAYWHPGGHWWDGYITGRDVVVDEYEPTTWSLTFILRLLDKYPLRVPVKGGYVEFNSKLIVITSHFNPEEWYFDRWPELKRRITNVFHMTKRYEGPPA